MSTLQTGTVLKHGGYAHQSRFNIVQHKYAGGEGGYIELLEILNPLFGKTPFVIYQNVTGYPKYVSYPSSFTEFKNLESANKAWGIYFSHNHNYWGKILKERFKFSFRIVNCDKKSPWFYADPWQNPDGDFVEHTPQLQLSF